MSIKSRQRNVKQPTHVGGRPRQFGKISKPAPFNVTQFAKDATAANTKTAKPAGAFGRLCRHLRKEVAI